MASPAAILVMGDFANQRCGVGSSERLVAGAVTGPIRVIDPTASSLRAFAGEARAAAREAEGAVLVFPTLSQVGRADLIPKAMALRGIMGRRWVRMHLHEFDRLDRRQRAAVALVAGLVADRVVVSSIGEADAIRRRYRGLAGRRAEVLIVPPANPSAPTPDELESVSSGDDVRSGGRTVGIHGQYRPDKGIDWLLATLRRLDRRFDRLEIAGRGWGAAPWPRSVVDRFEVTDIGQTDRADLPGVLRGWDLALAPFDSAPTDGRNSLRTPLAFGVPTLTRGPRPAGLRLDPPHLLFDDEVVLGDLPRFDPSSLSAGAAAVAAFEASVLAELASAMFGP